MRVEVLLCALLALGCSAVRLPPQSAALRFGRRLTSAAPTFCRRAKRNTKMYIDPCVYSDGGALEAGSTVEYFGLRTTTACGGVSYSVVRMFIAKAAGVGGETHTEVADTIGFVPTADLEFCSTTSCGACGSASTGGEENDNSCQDSSECCSCHCSSWSEYAAAHGVTGEPHVDIEDFGGIKHQFWGSEPSASSHQASLAYVLVDGLCTPTTTSTGSSCPSPYVTVKQFPTVCAETCDAVCSRTRDAYIPVLSGILTNYTAAYARLGSLALGSRRRSLLDEAWLERGDDGVVPASVGDTSAGDDFTYPASVEDLQLTSAWDTPGAAQQLSEPDAMDILDKFGTVYSNAQDLQSLSGVSIDLDGIKFEPDDIKGNSVKFVAGKVVEKVGGPLMSTFSSIATDLLEAPTMVANQVKALARIFTVTACMWQCASEALAKLRSINCEDICSKVGA